MPPTMTRPIVDESGYRAVLRAARAAAHFEIAAGEAAAALRAIPPEFTFAIPEVDGDTEEDAVRLTLIDQANWLARNLEEGDFGGFRLKDCEVLTELVEWLRDRDRFHAGELCGAGLRSLSDRAKLIIEIQREALDERESYIQSEDYRARHFGPTREEG